MSGSKKLIAGFGCREGKAVLSGAGAQEAEILELAGHCSDNGADELMIWDLAVDDLDHERTIGVVKEIVRRTDAPVIVGGRVKRLEDIKKYLYAGAKAAWLDMSEESNIDLIKEAADRFGSEKIYVRISDAEAAERAEEFVQLGASAVILDMGEMPAGVERAVRECGCEVLMRGESAEAGEVAKRLGVKGCGGIVLEPDRQQSGEFMELKQELKGMGVPVDTFESVVAWKDFKMNSDGLVPAVVQDYKTGEVLMLAYMNEESFEATLRTGKMTYFSRSRQELWLKGETSGHVQYVKALYLDCDNDTVLAKVAQVGAACHTGSRSCFFQELARKEYKETNPLKVFEDVYGVILDRKKHPKEGSYTNYLFEKGIDKILKKLGEEATEIVIAAKNPEAEEVKYEIADFLYHMMVLMAEKGVSWEEITEELSNR